MLQDANDGTATRLVIKHLGVSEYESIWRSMRDFTDSRSPDTPDELWLVEHLPVFTQGQAGKPEHILIPTDVPIVQTDRGGQVTYHGPGQLVAYPLLDLKRKGLGVRDLVTRIENSVIHCLAGLGVDAVAKPDAPGVYVAGCKIASLGLRVRRGCSFHGVSLNIDMDLSPFSAINPCGYAQLTMTQVRDLMDSSDIDGVLRYGAIEGSAADTLFEIVKNHYVDSLLKALNCHV